MSKITNPVVVLHWHEAPESACHIAITSGSTDFRDAEYMAVFGAGYTDDLMNNWSKTGYYMAAEIESLRQALSAAEKNLIDSECYVAELVSRKDRDNALIDTYDWQRQRLHEAAEKVLEWCRQEAQHRTGDAENAESCVCVRELRDALAFCESSRSSSAGASENGRSNENTQVVQEQSGTLPVEEQVQSCDSPGSVPVHGVTADKPLTITLPALPFLGSKEEWYQGFAAGAGSMREECAAMLISAGIGVEVK
ncbi:hypothetical protein ABKS77_14295 [Enterobacter cloacae]|nr:hypothetical protein [Enterobacter hormaechei]MCU2305791.1 hypothetical protein [Enterobacter hormaechei subsp. hormaechei]MCC9360925.1 hypothetical protein [Enterobacter hormaechei subsp. xiangfangensis]MCC9429027.1 hypothetical protein [Enterobacter hormaechei subsp. xiangfangensis]MCU2369200.1 hypothetical protein [Enterobacter hormaechei subsp. xiangfangensis]MCU2490265.1 hypothetical protein [Enterobacter hormaechei subsp. xiangfangensis]